MDNKTNNLTGYLLSFCILLASAPGAFSTETENSAAFKGLKFPIEIAFAPSHKTDSVIFETAISEQPKKEYDMILIQGEMPDPGLRVECWLKNKSLFKGYDKYEPASYRRFNNGRFWAKYKLPAPTVQPLRLAIVNTGVKKGGKLVIYNVELLKSMQSKENGALFPQTRSISVVYVPDPSLSLPESTSSFFSLVRRQTWNAQPPTEPYSTHTPVMMTLHHTQSHYPANLKESIEEVLFLQDFHQNGRGWIDVGYHFMIDPMGNIFEGRPIGVMGAHVKHYNDGNIGISILGTYHPPEPNDFTDASKRSFLALAGYLKERYSIQVSSFYAHRDLGKTTCPGDTLYAKVSELRQLVFNSTQPGAPMQAPVATMLEAEGGDELGGIGLQSQSMQKLKDQLLHNMPDAVRFD